MEVSEFVRGCVELEGGLAESDGDGLVEALVPASLREELHSPEMLRLALQPEAAVQHPDALPALPGSQTLDTFISFALEHGRATQAFPQLSPLRPRNIAPEIVNTLKFTARRVRLPEGEASVEPAGAAQFDFIVSLASDEVEERLQSVVVDLWSGSADPILTQTAPSLEVAETGPAAGRRNLHTVNQAYGVACAALSEWLAARLERHQALVARRLKDEHGRMALYYGSLIEDLRHRIHKTSESARSAALEQKIAATQEEQAAKVAELAEKYRLRPSARLAAVRTFTYPRLFSTVALDRRQGTRDLEVCWDPLTVRIRLPHCESCGKETAHVELSRDLRLLCPPCAQAAGGG